MRLANKSILFVEDEFLVAQSTMAILERLGARVVGPAYRLDKALALAQTASCDAAVVDLNLYGERSEPVIFALAARNIPVIVATGYARSDFGDLPHHFFLEKPYTEKNLAQALETVFAAE